MDFVDALLTHKGTMVANTTRIKRMRMDVFIIDDIVVSGGVAGLIGAAIRLVFSWSTFGLGYQDLTISHVYGRLVVQSTGVGGLILGTVLFCALWIVLGVSLAVLLALSGFKYWWLKGPGLVFVVWPVVYLVSQLVYRGPESPGVHNAVLSLSVSLTAGLVAGAFLSRFARWERVVDTDDLVPELQRERND